MANYQNLKAAISAAIRTNGNQEITGQVLQDVLNSIVSVIGANYTFAGVATPATNPGTPDQNVIYLAMEGGTYTNFNGTVLPAGISLLMWNGSWTSETVMYGDGGVFDISVYKSSGGTLATFADLSAALDGGNNIPASARKGGMSVKFVQSSDNKYVCYMLNKSAWSIDTNDWCRINISEKLPITLYDRYGEVATDESIVQSNGIFLKTDGTTGVAAALATSDYINISAYRGLKIRYEGKSPYSSNVAIVAFYNEVQNLISAISQITVIGTIVEISVPLNATYARFCSAKEGIDSFNCCVMWEHQILTTLAKMATKTIECELDSILYDKNHEVASDSNITSQNGCFIKISDGDLGYFAALATSDYIDVSCYQGARLKYIGKSDYTDNVAIIAYYSQNKTYISGVAQRTTLNESVLSIIPDNAYYIRVCSQKEGINGTKISVFGDIEIFVKDNKKKLSGLTTATKNGTVFDKHSDNTINFGLLNPVFESLGLTAVLHDIGFIGDSLSAGEIAYKKPGSDVWKYRDKYEFSWGQRLIDRICGNATLYAIGGLTTKTWWERYIVDEADGWSKDGGNGFADHKHTAYFIALGTNDQKIPMNIGDSTTDIDYNDYNQNADTFIGNYAKIIQKIREGNNRTPIFCVIYPQAVMLRMYDAAIKEMASLFSGVFIIDLYSALLNSGAIFDEYVNGGHFTTPGYQWVSWCIGCYVDSIIRNNLQYFQKQALINDEVDDGTIIW